MEKILITGASGFIGSFIVENALERGYDVWAAVRPSSDHRYLIDQRIHFINLDLSSIVQMENAIRNIEFDYIVHAAGLTKSVDPIDFYCVNYEGTKNLVKAIEATQTKVKRFVYISSLSVFGAIRERKPHRDIRPGDSPQPNTVYGKSKLMAEQWLSNHCELPVVILRPTGVYGPREKDYMMMADSISKHVDFAVGFTRQDLTFVYVKDVVKAVFLAMKSADSVGKAFFLSDGKVYSSRTFSDLIKKELDVKFVLRIVAPLFLLRIITIFGDFIGKKTGKVTALNRDKYNILAQRNWRCDITKAQDVLGYEPEYDLERGVKETMEWWKSVQ